MSSEIQTFLVYIIVVCTVVYFIWRWRNRKKRSCGGGDECGSCTGVKRNPVIEKIIREKQREEDRQE